MCTASKPSIPDSKPVITEPVNPSVADVDVGLTGDMAKRKKRQQVLGTRQLAIPTGSVKTTGGSGLGVV